MSAADIDSGISPLEKALYLDQCSRTTASPVTDAKYKKANDWLEQEYGIESTVDWCTLDINAKGGDES
ncbi:hypothetical protein FRC12_002285 [Ceratobasidium sp. 428]|nr:hypothetical protein FRC12_002285 [Ceratobasidium sp. 428]